ncbi:MAG: substrate-binding domain-containing protein [Prolixibacteraceae bacterium]|nr:substrate-binding domain-containing protein [Prolixibacteraceae bacterium]
MKGVFVSLILAVGLLSCNSFNSKDVKVGFLIHSSDNIRWQTDLKYLKDKADDMGVTFVMRDAGNDENVQLKQAHEILQEGIDVLIVVPANTNTAGGIVREAHEYGVKVISYDRMIKNAEIDYLISFEYERVGEIMVEYISEKVPGGNCIILWGEPYDANAVFIKNGQERILNSLKGESELNVLYKTYVEEWSGQTAEIIVNEVLDFSDQRLDAVIASNIPLAYGAYRAILNHGYKPGEVMITAMDLSVEYVRSMLNGEATMTVNKPIKDLAYGTMELAVAIAKNKKIESFEKTVYNGRIEVPAILFPPILIDKSNMENEVFEKGFYSREEVYQNEEINN